MGKKLLSNISSFIYNPNFTVVEGTIAGRDVLIPYPDGYNMNNTVIISWCILYPVNNCNYYWHEQCGAVLCSNNGIDVWFNIENHAFRGCTVKVWITRADKQVQQNVELIACGSTEKITELTTSSGKDITINIPTQVDVEYQVIFSMYLSGARSTEFSVRCNQKTLSSFRILVEAVTRDLPDSADFYIDYMVVRKR